MDAARDSASLADELRRWVGKSETRSDVATPIPYAALSATLDWPIVVPTSGTPLPPLWHWLYFLPLYRQSDVGPDGHARRGGFLPPVPLPRRMWAGSQMTFARALAIGDTLTRTSTIDDIREKSGSSGALVFVKVRHEVRVASDRDPALVEFHDIVYREAPRPGAASAAPRAAPGTSAWQREVVPDDVLLFRYSALTFNGHRIHYDRRYVTEVEGYPGLIVHGPLLATLLLDLVRREMPRADVAGFEFRAMKPVFDLHPFHVCGEPEPDGRRVHLWIRDYEGSLAMDATATLR
jgi:3-methylfumaryl-CoA hydratase